MRRVLASFLLLLLLSMPTFAQNNIFHDVYRFLQNAKYQEALNILEENYHVYQEVPEYLWLWSTVYLMSGNKDTAVVKAQEAFLKTPEPESLDYRRYGIILREAGHAEESIKMFQTALEKEPEDIWSLYYLALMLEENKRELLNEESDSYWERLEQLHLKGKTIPTLGFYYLGELHHRNGNTEQALEYFAKFVLEHESQSVAESELMMRALVYLQTYSHDQ